MLTYERTPDYVLTISDEAYRMFAADAAAEAAKDEQLEKRKSVTVGSVAASGLILAAYVLFKFPGVSQ